jgi:hypothetical protein
VVGPSLTIQHVLRNLFLQNDIRNSPNMSRYTTKVTVCDFRLLLRCKLDLHSPGMLCSADEKSVTDVSGQPIGPIFKHQAVQKRMPGTLRYAVILGMVWVETGSQRM